MADPIDRPVGEVVPVGLPVQAGGGNVGVEGEVVFGLGDEPGRIALDGGLDHGGVGVDEGGGGTGGKSSVSDQILDQRILCELVFALVGKSVPVGIVPGTAG